MTMGTADPMSAEAPTQSDVPDYSRSAVSRYIQLATLFRSKIEAGVWEVGMQIPTVEDLAREFGVARITIRDALGLLEREGLVERYRGRGSFVTNRPRQTRLWTDVQTDWAGLLNAGREDAEIRILVEEEGVPPPLLTHAIGRPAPAYRHLRRLHRRDGTLFLLGDIYIDERIVPRIPRAQFSTTTAFGIISHVPRLTVTKAEQTLTVQSADVDEARLLELSLNAPVARVDRTAVDQHDDLVLFAKGIYRGDLVRFNVTLK
jgi:GntR family transcriptional regulator